VISAYLPFLVTLHPNSVQLTIHTDMRNVLLVDDDPLFRRVVRDDLSKNEFRVKDVISLTPAKEALSKENFDIILLDIRLPDGNGLDWAEELNRNPARPPIIFLTTSNDITLVKKGFEIGCEDYIKKPFSNAELVMRMRRVFNDFKDINRLNRRIGSYSFNPITHRLTLGNKSHVLGRLQAAVLDELSIRPGAVVSKEELLNRYWVEATYFTSRNLDSVIVKLRAHFKEDPSVHFLALKREGYRLFIYKEGDPEEPIYRQY
jgi:DNA-binding response OmpR family regulator